MGMAHYKVILAYDGSAFAGFQRQKKARTVQGAFEAALRQMGWQGKSIWAAGRTDAGVHAKGQVVRFALNWRHSPEDLRNALNFHLPQDVAARDVSPVSADFQPRFDAVSRRYRYHVFCQPVRDPLREGFAWRVWPPVDPEPMQAAAGRLIGAHDFGAFGRPMTPNGVTIREVFSAGWKSEGDTHLFDIRANAFLYHMVRRIVIVLVRVGQGEASLAVIDEALQTGRLKLTGLAPAEGLVLEEVCY
jgi:tRNA pseudouridine38-40 synthase